MSTQPPTIAELPRAGQRVRRGINAVRPEARTYEFYVRTTQEVGDAMERIAAVLGMSRSEVGAEALAMWLVACRKELAKDLSGK